MVLVVDGSVREDERPLRVLYSFPHPLGAPGIGTTAINQVRGLVGAGHVVTVYATSLTEPVDGLARLVRTMTVAGRRVPHRAIGIDRAYRYHDRVVASTVRRGASRFDVVHAWPRGCLATFAAARRAGVASFRESPNPHTAAAFEDAARAAASVGLEVPVGHSHHADPQRLAIEVAEYDAADFVLVPSDYVMESYLSRGIDPRRLVRHRYGFDPVAFPAPAIDRPQRPFTGLFLGSGEPRKGLHVALRAWKDAGLGAAGTPRAGAGSAARGARFLIAGRIEPAYREKVVGDLVAAGAEELGFVSDTGSVLRESDVLLLPSWSEGSALVTYEAMASGAVPLVSAAAGSPVIDGHDGMLHEVGDVDGLAAQLRRLSGDAALLASLRAGGLARRDELSWTAAGRALAAGYRTGLARGRR